MFGLGTALVALPANAVEMELKHDGFTDNGQAVCQQGFAIDDEAGSTFTHDQPFRLLRMHFLFCGADTMETVTARVYRETGGSVPGEMLYEADYQIQGADNALSEIDLTQANLTFGAGESFRFTLRLQHDGTPGLANDTDGVGAANTSWIYDTLSSSWAQASAFGVNGDWIMRATIDAEMSGSGGAGPASTTATMMTGAGGAGGEGGGDAGSDDKGDSCSCRVTGAPGSGQAAWLAVGAGLILARRRRR